MQWRTALLMLCVASGGVGVVVAAAGATRQRANGPLVFTAFVQFSGANTLTGGFSVDTNGRGLRRLTELKDTAHDLTSVDVSSDGGRIAWGGHDGVFVTDLYGGHVRRVWTRAVTGVAWSPDGSRLAIVGFSGPVITIVRLGSGAQARRIRTGRIWPWKLSWSPDSRLLAFAGQRNGEGGDELYRVGVNGSNLMQLTATDGSAGEGAWSPDGGRLVFPTGAPHNGVWIVDRNGRAQHQIRTGAPGWPDCCAWSPDGRFIAYTAFPFPGRDTRLIIVRPTGKLVSTFLLATTFLLVLRPHDFTVDAIDWG